MAAMDELATLRAEVSTLRRTRAADVVGFEHMTARLVDMTDQYHTVSRDAICLRAENEALRNTLAEQEAWRERAEPLLRKVADIHEDTETGRDLTVALDILDYVVDDIVPEARALLGEGGQEQAQGDLTVDEQIETLDVIGWDELMGEGA